jgi:hypothetical protein
LIPASPISVNPWDEKKLNVLWLFIPPPVEKGRLNS